MCFGNSGNGVDFLCSWSADYGRQGDADSCDEVEEGT